MTAMPGKSRKTTATDTVRTPLTLRVADEDGTNTDTAYLLGGIAGVGTHGLMVNLTHPDTEALCVVGLRADTGRFQGAGTIIGDDDAARVALAMEELLRTDDGHQRFVDAIATLDQLAVTGDTERSLTFRRGAANAWIVSHDAPAAIHEAIGNASRTCTGTIADLGQALLAATHA